MSDSSDLRGFSSDKEVLLYSKINFQYENHLTKKTRISPEKKIGTLTFWTTLVQNTETSLLSVYLYSMPTYLSLKGTSCVFGNVFYHLRLLYFWY